MSVNLGNALLITVIGMGLVFASILLLWVLMAGLVRLFDKKQIQQAAEDKQIANLDVSRLRKQRAAAIAVSVALAQHADQNEPHEFPLPPPAMVSAWQAVMRTKMHTKRGTSK